MLLNILLVVIKMIIRLVNNLIIVGDMRPHVKKYKNMKKNKNVKSNKI